MTGYILSADADLDLDEIWDYVTAGVVRSATKGPSLFYPKREN